jgi:cytochrome oxidase assembly protein ShyY1
VLIVFRFLLSPRWVALTLACIFVIPAFQALAEWQWRRLDQRHAYNQAIQAQISKAPIAISELVLTGSSPLELADEATWRTVELTGTWIAQSQVLVRKQSLESNTGLWVVTPLLLNDGTIAIVNRGWTPAANSATESPVIQQLPIGVIEVLGRVRAVTPRTKSAPTDLPTGQVDRIIPLEIYSSDSTISDSYIEMTASRPESRSADIRELPAPEVTEGNHRSYAIQWTFFEFLTVVGWVVLVRNEVIDQRKKISLLE